MRIFPVVVKRTTTAPPPSSGDEVTRERLVYDLPQTHPAATVRETLAMRALETTPPTVDEAAAGLLVVGNETAPLADDVSLSLARVIEQTTLPTITTLERLALLAAETPTAPVDVATAVVRLLLFETPPVAADALASLLRVLETAPAATTLEHLALRSAELAPLAVDTESLILVTAPETPAAPADSLLVTARSVDNALVPAPVALEALQLMVAEALGAFGDAGRAQATISAGANANTVSGSVTNPANAHGQPNGTMAATSGGALSNGTGTLTLLYPDFNMGDLALNVGSGPTGSLTLTPDGDVSGFTTADSASGWQGRTGMDTAAANPAASGAVAANGFSTVDDGSPADDTDAVVFSGAGPVTGVLNLTTDTIPSGSSVTGVTVSYRYRNTNGSSRSLQLRLTRSNGTVLATGTAHNAGQATFTAGSFAYSGALSQSDVDGLRVELTGSNTLDQLVVSQVSVAVDYAPGGGPTLRAVGQLNHGLGNASRAAISYSLNNGSSFTALETISAGGAFDRTYTLPITTQAQLNGLQVRFALTGETLIGSAQVDAAVVNAVFSKEYP